MTKLLSALLWTAVFCALLLAIDQVFVHVPLKGVPVLAEAGTFYLDFRGRLVGLTQAEVPLDSVEKVIDRHAGSRPEPLPVSALPVSPVVAAVPGAAPSGYFFADGEGELHFVDRLDQVPTAFRKEAQPLLK